MCDTHDSEFDGDTDTESDMSLSSVEHPRIHSQILRVNHQVYQESSSVLYSEATFVLDPEDILCLSKTKVRPYGAAPFEHFDPPLNKLWRYDPRKGVGCRNRKGDIVYKTPKSEGVLDPHVFARFRKIKFDSYLVSLISGVSATALLSCRGRGIIVLQGLLKLFFAPHHPSSNYSKITLRSRKLIRA